MGLIKRTSRGRVATDKAYEQAIGFLRITEGTNILDRTRIHPESYNITNKTAAYAQQKCWYSFTKDVLVFCLHY